MHFFFGGLTRAVGAKRRTRRLFPNLRASVLVGPPLWSGARRRLGLTSQEQAATASCCLTEITASCCFSLRQPAASSSTAPPQARFPAREKNCTKHSSLPLLPRARTIREQKRFRSPTNAPKMKKVKTNQRKSEKKGRFLKISNYFILRQIKSNNFFQIRISLNYESASC